MSLNVAQPNNQCSNDNIILLAIGIIVTLLSFIVPYLSIMKIAGAGLIGAGLLSLLEKWNKCLCNCSMSYCTQPSQVKG